MKEYLFNYWPHGEHWQRATTIEAATIDEALALFKAEHKGARIRSVWVGIKGPWQSADNRPGPIE